MQVSKLIISPTTSYGKKLVFQRPQEYIVREALEKMSDKYCSKSVLRKYVKLPADIRDFVNIETYVGRSNIRYN